MKAKSISHSLFFTLLLLFVLQITLAAQTTVIKGKLLDVEGKPSKYALVGVSLIPGGNGQDFVPCDENGNYTFDSVPDGRFKVIIKGVK